MTEGESQMEGKSILLEIFGEAPEVRLIDFFMDNPLFDFTKKDIIEELGMNKRTLYRIMPKLEEEGLVMISRKIGKAKLYRVNKENYIIRCLRSIEKEHSLRELGDDSVKPIAFEPKGIKTEIE